MKQILRILTLFISSCSFNKQGSKTTKAKQEKILQTTVQKESIGTSEEPLPNQRFKKSEIIAPTFDRNLLFGVWTLSADAPACEFEITLKRDPLPLYLS